MQENIIIKGAKENNLKNIDLVIPRDKFIVITGLSGSGKSSLAFDTIYAEGRRRYVESLSSYARQFLGQMEKPHVDSIDGLSPAISIDQKWASRNPRSTVGTVTEIHDYLRILFARIGIPHCPICGKEISAQTVDQIVDNILSNKDGTKIIILAPLIREKKGTYEKVFERIKREGFIRVRVDSEMLSLDDGIPKLNKNLKHNIEVVIDRIVLKSGIRTRLTDSIELAIKLGEGVIGLLIGSDDKMQIVSTILSCPEHNFSMEKLEPKMFSFNSPFGACEKCNGLGFIQKINPELMITETEKPLLGGALTKVFSNMEFGGYWRQSIEALAKNDKVDISVPYKDLPKKFKERILYGTGDEKISYVYKSLNSGRTTNMNHSFEGVLTNLERRYRETNSEYIKKRIEDNMSFSICPSCKGKRFKPEILAVTIGHPNKDAKLAKKPINIAELSDLSIDDSLNYMSEIKLTEKEKKISEQIAKESEMRLKFLKNVGLSYLTLSRSAGTLSGGEAQRIRLASQIGSALMGVLYILDEPSIGLHQKDNAKLLATLRDLTNLGNTLLVVEHDEETMLEADEIIDIGPGAGENGGEVVVQGNIEKIKKCKTSITGDYLSGRKKIHIPKKRREGSGEFIEIIGAKENNLKNIDVKFPLGKFIAVTGVSGSGKSSLINEILYKELHRVIMHAKEEPGKFEKIIGIHNIDKVINIDQSPIGRTPRSNPATYIGVFDFIRNLFANLTASKMRGYGKGRFSFNVKGGRCEACKGDGVIKIEMHFLPDVYVTCDVCGGHRYNKETLSIKFKGKNIFDILDMRVSEALPFFENIPHIREKLETLDKVGLSYIKLGQQSTTLSGGESQRVKLAAELSKKATGRTLYILDEPTTGLHFEDTSKLIDVLNELTDLGNTIIVIEHNLDVIKCADHIIDIGKDGGNSGGEIIAEGTPEEVAKNKESYTGEYLRKILKH